MSAGMRRSHAPPIGDSDDRIAEITTDDAARVVEVSGGEDAPVIDVIEPVVVDAAAIGLDVSDPAYSPIGVPVALTRGGDGVLRADRDAIASRASRAEVAAEFASHYADQTPHPAYDDLPDLTLIFENRLV